MVALRPPHSLVESDRRTIDEIAASLPAGWPVDAIVLYGSKARGDDRPGTHPSATSPGPHATHRAENGGGRAIGRAILRESGSVDNLEMRAADQTHYPTPDEEGMLRPTVWKPSKAVVFAWLLCMLMLGGELLAGEVGNPITLVFYCFLPAALWMIALEQQRDARKIAVLKVRVDQLEEARPALALSKVV